MNPPGRRPRPSSGEGSGDARRADGAGGDDLLAFPRPSVAVDVAMLTVVPSGRPEAGAATPTPDVGGDGPLDLAVLLLRRSAGPSAGAWGLPGSFVRERERLADAVLRTLRDKCGIEGLEPRQLHVFDDPARDDRGWVLSVAHVVAVRAETLADALASRDDLALARIGPGSSADVDATDLPSHRSPGRTPGRTPGRASAGTPDRPDPAGDGGRPGGRPGHGPVTVGLPDGQRTLPFDHAAIVALAVADLRDRYDEHPDPAGLAGGPDHTFTLLQLRRVHEAVLGHPLQKDTFRRQVIDDLEEVEGAVRRSVGRPARLYRHRPTT